MTFQFKLPSKRRPRFSVDRLSRPAENEQLTGWVHGKEASDIEERFARALDTAGYDYAFRVEIPVSTGRYVSDKEIDFLVTTGGQRLPVEIDGYIGHHTASQKGADQLREALLNKEFARLGWRNIQRVAGTDLRSQEHADWYVRGHLVN